ncbi:MAG: thiamine biosynthesis protein [Desulfobia sp.]
MAERIKRGIDPEMIKINLVRYQHEQQKKERALALFSGGLDSILACRVIADQGIDIKAVKYISPFFDYNLLNQQEEYCRNIKEKYGIDVIVKDISQDYLALLHNPPHGFGKHFNPCIDCKIMMIRKTLRMMPEYNASFIISGEVISQRLMSQRRDALRIIERDSGSTGILMRPLCARSLEPTEPEEQGIVNREELPDFKGRSRTPQMELAKNLGIEDYPSPAGGCILTDPILGKRIKSLYGELEQIGIADIRFILTGRQFRLPHGGRLIMGRRKKENERIAGLKQPGDIELKPEDRPGPLGLLRYSKDPEDIARAASLIVTYSKKSNILPLEGLVKATDDEYEKTIRTLPLQKDCLSTRQL